MSAGRGGRRPTRPCSSTRACGRRRAPRRTAGTGGSAARWCPCPASRPNHSTRCGRHVSGVLGMSAGPAAVGGPLVLVLQPERVDEGTRLGERPVLAVPRRDGARAQPVAQTAPLGAVDGVGTDSGCRQASAPSGSRRATRPGSSTRARGRRHAPRRTSARSLPSEPSRGQVRSGWGTISTGTEVPAGTTEPERQA